MTPDQIFIVAPNPNKKNNILGVIATLYGKILRNNGFNITYVDSKKIFSFWMVFTLLRFRKKILLIHVHSSGFLGDIPLLFTFIISKIIHKPYIVTYHCGNPEYILNHTNMFVSFLFKSALYITVPSKYSKQILLKYNPNIISKLYYFPNLIDSNDWSFDQKKICNQILTVSAINYQNIRRKGLWYFIKTAELLPDYNFYIVGGYDDSINYLKRICPKNVIFTGYLNDIDLKSMYSRSNIYCQLSTSESFGYALAEAMLCGCVPVVTKFASIPEIVGDTGFFSELDPKDIAKNIELAIISNNGKKCRLQIINNFDINIKKDALIILFNKILSTVKRKYYD